MTDVRQHCSYQHPCWMDHEFVQNIVKKTQSDEDVLRSFDITPATSQGENFNSQIFRIRAVTEKNEIVQIIAKSFPIGENVEKFIRSMNFFEKEIKVFSQTLPVMKRILESVNIQPLFADIYHYQGYPNDAIILEDLCVSGLKSANRLEGLDLDHSTLVVRSLAIFHAASMKAIREDSDIIKRHEDIYWHHKNKKVLQSFVVEGLSSLEQFIRDCDVVPENFFKRFSEFKNVAFDKIFRACDRDDSGFNVLTHGDSWTNNFLFHYVNGLPTYLKFVDFQNTCINHPVTDLLFFMFTSPKNDCKVTKIDFLLDCYYGKLKEVCSLMGEYLPMSFEDLRKSFITRLAFGFVISITVFPFTTAPPDESVELDEFLVDSIDANKNRQFRTQQFLDGIKIMLPYFIENGVFD